MLLDVKVPVLAESVAEATLLSWQKRPGDVVKRGDNLIEIETDKVVLEVPSPGDGVLKEILKEDGTAVASDELLARVDTDYAAQAMPAQEEPPQVVPKEPAAEATAAGTPPLSPSVRRLITEHGLDPKEITGSGRGGRLTKADVMSHLAEATAAPLEVPAPPAEPPAAPPADSPASPAQTPPRPVAAPPATPSRGERREPMSRLRGRIAERLLAAQRNAAILTTFNEVDMGPVMALRKRYRDRFEQQHGAKLGFMSFFAKASVLALQRFPAVNAFIDGNDIVYHDYCDIGIAVGSPRGLVVPVLRDAAALSFADIESYIADVAVRAEGGKLNPEELVGGTFTITNGGVFGSLLSTPILNPPQSAILGMHKIQERPMVVNGEIIARPMMYLALSYDHRIVDGREAVQFLVTIKDAIEDPARLLLEI